MKEKRFLSGKVGFEFPLGDQGAELLPLDVFRGEELVVAVLAKDLVNQWVVPHFLKGVLKVLGEVGDALGFTLLAG